MNSEPARLLPRDKTVAGVSMTNHLKREDIRQARFLYYFGLADKSHLLRRDYTKQVNELASKILKYSNNRDLWPILADMVTFSSAHQAPGMHLLDLLARFIIVTEHLPYDWDNGWEILPPLDISGWHDAHAMTARYYLQKFVDGELQPQEVCVSMIRHVDTVPFLQVFYDIRKLSWLEQDTRIRQIVPDMLEKLDEFIRDFHRPQHGES